ncbi:unnamed protein product [Coregonus sp. 'balchen']|nr:unnamed protein product [Coregonus sp. 'balchen']
MIEQAELLEGHHKLMNLKCSWNDLMYKQYRIDSKNTHNMNLILNYFGKCSLWIACIECTQSVTRESDKMWLKKSQT